MSKHKVLNYVLYYAFKANKVSIQNFSRYKNFG